jgi:predicted TIM-barrel fold metal-dependent hydrolase
MLERMDIVDSHHHFFDFRSATYPWLAPGRRHRFGDVTPIARDYATVEYEADVAPHRIIADVHVEAHRASHHDPIEETRWLNELRRTTGRPSVCIAAAALDGEGVADRLAAQAQFDFVRGIRDWPDSPHRPMHEGRSRLDDPGWRSGFSRLADHDFLCEIITDYIRLEALARLAADFPATTIVVNHMAYPMADLDEGRMRDWEKAIERIAPHRNVVMKISGMCLGGPPWRLESHEDPIRHVIRTLGAERCMFGSNFPVDRLVGSFDRIASGVASIVDRLGAVDAVFRDTATRLYRLAR